MSTTSGAGKSDRGAGDGLVALSAWELAEKHDKPDNNNNNVFLLVART